VKATKEEIITMLSDAYDFGTAVLKEQTPESINLLLDKETFFFGASTRGASCGLCWHMPWTSTGRWSCTSA